MHPRSRTEAAAALHPMHFAFFPSFMQLNSFKFTHSLSINRPFFSKIHFHQPSSSNRIAAAARMSSNLPLWYRMSSNLPLWYQMSSNLSLWYQMSSNLSLWYQMSTFFELHIMLHLCTVQACHSRLCCTSTSMGNLAPEMF